MPHYTVVIIPSEPVIAAVKAIKLRLLEAIGWYPSVHSLAHITFNLFSGGELTLLNWKRYVEQFATQSLPFTCCLDRTGHFNNGAFFLAPNETSKPELVAMMKAFHQSAPKGGFGKSVNPHVSIGRKLSTDQLQIAKELTGEVNLQFYCDNLAIRKFDPQQGQYILLEQMNFKKMDHG